METSEKNSKTAPPPIDNTIAIIAYLTLIGLLIAFIMNQEKKQAFGSYHIKQSLGLCACSIALMIIGLIPLLGWLVSVLGSLFLLYLWIMGIMNAVNRKEEPVPFLGKKFEEWFASL